MTAVADTGASPLGILAGGTGLPCEIAEAVARRGRGVHIVGLEGEAEPGIERFPHTWVNWGGIGAMIRAFRTSGCREIVIVGRVRRPNLARLRPDLGFWQSLPLLLRFLRGGDDAILRMVVGFFERHGLAVVGVPQVAPELLAPAGFLGEGRPTAAERAAIATCAAALAAVGPFDAAQAAVARGDVLIGLEGADGTDAMLRRLGAGDARGAVLVKLPKPQQERRIDLPAVGPETMRRSAEAGLAGIAVRTGETLIAERREAIRLADQAGLFVMGVPDGGALPAAGPEPSRGEGAGGKRIVEDLKPLARILPAPRHLDDAELAARVIGALEPFWDRASSIASRGYVLATQRQGGAREAAVRAGRLKPWGARLLRRKVGVLVMTDIAGELGPNPAALVDSAQASGLAGIAILHSPKDEAALAALRTAADAAGLFLLAPGDAR